MRLIDRHLFPQHLAELQLLTRNQEMQKLMKEAQKLMKEASKEKVGLLI